MYHDDIPKGSQVVDGTEIASETIKCEITKKVRKRELSFLYATRHHDQCYITVKNHDNIPKGIQVIERTGNCI